MSRRNIMKNQNNTKIEKEDLKEPTTQKGDNSGTLNKKEVSELLTPEGKRQELTQKDIIGDELELFMKAYEEKYKRELLQQEDVLKTSQALEYLNKHLEQEGLVKHKKDLLTITNLRELTIKPNDKGQLIGRLMPIDPHAAKKIGFHFKKDVLDQFLTREIELRKSDKEALFIENEQLKQRVKDLETQLQQFQKVSNTNTKATTQKAKEKPFLEGVQLSFDEKQLNFIYNKKRFYANFEGEEFAGLEEVIGAEGETKPASKQMLNKLKSAIIEEREDIRKENQKNENNV